MARMKKVKSSSSYRAKLKIETTQVSLKPFFDTIGPFLNGNLACLAGATVVLGDRGGHHIGGQGEPPPLSPLVHSPGLAKQRAPPPRNEPEDPEE